MKTLICFAKEPQPGEVKTRLAASIGAAAAVQLYIAFLKEIAGKLPDCGADRIIIASPGAEAKPELTALFPSPPFSHHQQQGATLGERMAASFEEAFAAGGSRVVMIGSDSPHFPPEEVSRAFQELEAHDAVIGPAPDGGFWLVGLRRYAELFSALPLSTPTAYEALLHAVEAQAFRYALVAACSDIDTIEDVKRLLPHEAFGPRLICIRS